MQLLNMLQPNSSQLAGAEWNVTCLTCQCCASHILSSRAQQRCSGATAFNMQSRNLLWIALHCGTLA